MRGDKAQSPDRIYIDELDLVEDFSFDEHVANVFPDMILRSVPGYSTLVQLIGIIGAESLQEGTRCYDLGCSRGAVSLAVRRRLSEKADVRIVAVDNSLPMLRKLRERLQDMETRQDIPIDPVCADIRTLPLTDASVVILNFTLQFVPPEERNDLLRQIHRQMLSPGLLILSEKIRFSEHEMEQRIGHLHLAFKRANGYSDLEISQKRTALEKVLIPDTPERLRKRLDYAGFRAYAIWFQCLNFISILAWKAS